MQRDFDYRTSKIKFYSVRALKSYLSEKTLIHDRVTATISKFSPQISETYFGQIFANRGLINRWKMKIIQLSTKYRGGRMAKFEGSVGKLSKNTLSSTFFQKLFN